MAQMAKPSQSLLTQLKAINPEEKQIVLISTTAKSNHENRRLPSHIIAGKTCLNLIINDEETAKEAMVYLDDYADYFFIDIERKQAISLWEIAQKVIKKGIILPYKPNDITKEAASALINQFFNYNISQKKILIYGTGNIATKLAINLAEHEAHVSLAGRNVEKVELLKESLNAILPAHSEAPITIHSSIKKYDILISVLSGEYCVDDKFIDQLKENALVIDIGINNLTQEFIQQAQKKSIQLFRLDVRIGSPFIEASLEAYHTAFLTRLAGHHVVQEVSCVAGGAIGERGALIVDNIALPKQIIGIANGTGGIKKHEEYTERDHENLKKIEAIL